MITVRIGLARFCPEIAMQHSRKLLITRRRKAEFCVEYHIRRRAVGAGIRLGPLFLHFVVESRDCGPEIGSIHAGAATATPPIAARAEGQSSARYCDQHRPAGAMPDLWWFYAVIRCAGI